MPQRPPVRVPAIRPRPSFSQSGAPPGDLKPLIGSAFRRPGGNGSLVYSLDGPTPKNSGALAGSQGNGSAGRGCTGSSKGSSQYVAQCSVRCEASGGAKPFLQPQYTGCRYDVAKPPFSYASLIAQALLACEDRKLTLNQIYMWIMEKYPYYHSENSGWQNSIRHNLSLNSCFVKIAKAEGDSGKGSYWSINEDEMDILKNGTFKRRKLTSSTSSTDEAPIGARSAGRRVATGNKRSLHASGDGDDECHEPRRPSRADRKAGRLPPRNAAGSLSNSSIISTGSPAQKTLHAIAPSITDFDRSEEEGPIERGTGSRVRLSQCMFDWTKMTVSQSPKALRCRSRGSSDQYSQLPSSEASIHRRASPGRGAHVVALRISSSFNDARVNGTFGGLLVEDIDRVSSPSHREALERTMVHAVSGDLACPEMVPHALAAFNTWELQRSASEVRTDITDPNDYLSQI